LFEYFYLEKKIKYREKIERKMILPLENKVQQIDRVIIPNAVYDLVIERKTLQLKKYLEQHPKLMFNIAQFNQTLKVSNQYASDNKCNCAYQLPWVTKYGATNNLGKSIYLSFTQQVEMYRYMIRYWYPYPKISNMRYLSMVALGTLQELKLAKTMIGEGKNPCVVGQKDVIVGKTFSSNYKFIQYLDNHYIWL
jgi:hypothetical protein